MGQIKFFEFIENLSFKETLYICKVPVQIPYLGKIGFLKYAVSQSGGRVFKSTVSPEKKWNNLIFYMVIQSHERSKLIETFLDEYRQKCGWSFWSQNFKIGWISGMNAISWFFVWWYKFRKAKSYFIGLLVIGLIFCMLIVMR